MISVHSIHNTTYEVTVAGKTTTTHRVTVNPACYEQLTGGRVSPDQRDNRLGVLLVDDLRGRALAAVGSTAGTETRIAAAAGFPAAAFSFGMPVTPPPHPIRYIGNRCIEPVFYNCETADAT